MDTKDFTPTKEQITLHGLGFIQLTLPANRRLHVWHPSLPHRACFDYSPVHNHRFSFRSTVLVGQQVNVRCKVTENAFGAFDMISHDGPRRPNGSRESYVSGRCIVDRSLPERYGPGESYEMAEFEYHETPNSGVVVTLLEKLSESKTAHAHSIIAGGHEFDQDFDRFQFPPHILWGFVREALES